MAKPVLIISFPIQVELDDMSQAVLPIQNRLTDYHIIAYRSSNISDLEFKVLNAEKADDLDIEALKEEVKNQVFNS